MTHFERFDVVSKRGREIFVSVHIPNNHQVLNGSLREIPSSNSDASPKFEVHLFCHYRPFGASIVFLDHVVHQKIS